MNIFEGKDLDFWHDTLTIIEILLRNTQSWCKIYFRSKYERPPLISKMYVLLLLLLTTRANSERRRVARVGLVAPVEQVDGGQHCCLDICENIVLVV